MPLMPDLNPTHREALTKTLNADLDRAFLSYGEHETLIALRDACPEQSILEDGIYEVPTTGGGWCVQYVRNGRHSTWLKSDGTLFDDGRPLPADVSTWRRIDGLPSVTPEQVEEAARAASYFSEPQWAALPETRRGYYRDYTHRILAVAGIEVSE